MGDATLRSGTHDVSADSSPQLERSDSVPQPAKTHTLGV